MEVLAIEHTLTELDHARLARLVHRYKSGPPTASPTRPIEHVLQAAEVVPWSRLSPDVTRVSVLSPLGGSLIGRRAGATVHWPTPRGGQLTSRILSVLFQPETSGHFAR